MNYNLLNLSKLILQNKVLKHIVYALSWFVTSMYNVIMTDFNHTIYINLLAIKICNKQGYDEVLIINKYLN